MSAILSPCGRYRYWLERKLTDPAQPGMFSAVGKGTVGFLMLNPSTADATNDDPTIRRCIGFAKRIAGDAAGRLVVVNLFALRSTDPSALVLAEDPVGPENDAAIERALRECGWFVCAWGAQPFVRVHDRAREVMKRFSDGTFSCLGRTVDGHPRHPLYLPADAKREDFR